MYLTLCLVSEEVGHKFQTQAQFSNFPRAQGYLDVFLVQTRCQF